MHTLISEHEDQHRPHMRRREQSRTVRKRRLAALMAMALIAALGPGAQAQTGFPPGPPDDVPPASPVGPPIDVPGGGPPFGSLVRGDDSSNSSTWQLILFALSSGFLLSLDSGFWFPLDDRPDRADEGPGS